VSPVPVNLNVTTSFDGSASCAGPLTGASICSSTAAIVSYSWDFGDGFTATGRTTTHRYSRAGTFTVKLTVVNDHGIAASKTQSLDVAAVTPPAGDWVSSPAAPAVGQTVQFNASGIQAAAGHSIVKYDWNFGDGGTAVGVITSHVFATAGTWNVTLIATDDTSQTTTRTHSVSVGTGASGGGAATASFTFSPASPSVNTGVSFDATASTPSSGAQITTYVWTFGDNTAQGNGVQVQHFFNAAKPYTVTLTIVDTAGQSNSLSKTVTVTP
jgi:PKD repeat protein